jgi:hypothetical protein
MPLIDIFTLTILRVYSAILTIPQNIILQHYATAVTFEYATGRPLNGQSVQPFADFFQIPAMANT